MLIAVEYRNGRIKEFDANAFTSNEAMSGRERSARNALTEFDLRLDRIEEDGLRLNIFWHDVSHERPERIRLDDTLDENGAPVELKGAYRRPGCSIMIANRAVLDQISRIIVYRANQPVQVAWRQGSGNWQINGALFEAQRVLTYTDANTTSLNSQAVSVYRYLERANPQLDPEEICALMGYPYEAYQEIRGDEGAQLEEGSAPAAPDPGGPADASDSCEPDPSAGPSPTAEGDPGAWPDGFSALLAGSDLTAPGDPSEDRGNAMRAAAEAPDDAYEDDGGEG